MYCPPTWPCGQSLHNSLEAGMVVAVPAQHDGAEADQEKIDPEVRPDEVVEHFRSGDETVDLAGELDRGEYDART